VIVIANGQRDELPVEVSVRYGRPPLLWRSHPQLVVKAKRAPPPRVVLLGGHRPDIAQSIEFSKLLIEPPSCFRPPLARVAVALAVAWTNQRKAEPQDGHATGSCLTYCGPASHRVASSRPRMTVKHKAVRPTLASIAVPYAEPCTETEHPLISVRRFVSSIWSGAALVVCPCIAVIGLWPCSV
jgi:hypothetical protein